MPSNRAQLLAGVRALAPILLGTMPFGMIHGLAAAEAGLPAGAALGMSAIVFAGSAQFIAAGLFGAGAPGLVIVLTTLVVNLRHVLYSASIAPYVRHLSPAWKYLLAFLLTDEAYAVAITHYRRDSPEAAARGNTHWYTLGAGLTLWVTWQISSAAGVVIGAQVPASWSLDFTLALTFIALLIPALTDRRRSWRHWRRARWPCSPGTCLTGWGCWSRRGPGSAWGCWRSVGGVGNGFPKPASA